MLVRLIFGMGIVFLAVAGVLVFQPGGQTDTLQQVAEVEVVPDVVAEAVTERRTDLIRIIGSETPTQVAEVTPDVTPGVAAQSAAFAEALRQSTGAVPDAQENATSILTTPQDRVYGVPDAYFVIWNDLMRRCWASVSGHVPFDETGLTPVGDERVDYGTAYTQQEWYTEGKLFLVTYKVDGAYVMPTELRRTCMIQTNRFALVNSIAVAKLKEHYDAWWAEEDLERFSTFQEYPYTLREGDQYHRALTEFGSAQGCEMFVEYRDMEIGRERDATFFLVETDKLNCEATAGRSSGAVRINRLPQVNP